LFVFQFVGLGRRAGKTSTIVQLVKLFSKKGIRVGVVKHGHSYDPAFDLRSGEDAKDTVRFVEAGSAVAVVVTDELTVTITNIESLERVVENLSNQVDIAFLEGFKETKCYPRVIVAEATSDISQLLTSTTIAVTGKAAVMCYEELKHLYPSLNIARSAEELAETLYSFMIESITEKIGGKSCGVCGHLNCEEFIKALRTGKARPTACPQVSPRVSVYLDGKPLSLNPFVQSIIEKTLRGMLSSLKGVGKHRRTEIFISSPPEE